MVTSKVVIPPPSATTLSSSQQALPGLLHLLQPLSEWSEPPSCKPQERHGTESKSYRLGRRNGVNDVFTKSPPPIKKGNGNFLLFSFHPDSPPCCPPTTITLNYEASQLNNTKGSERPPPRPGNPPFTKWGRCVSSSKQVHQKQVFGNNTCPKMKK